MPTEAAIVHDVFDRFAAGDNCNGIACAMNARCVAAFGGRRWCLLTMRRMLLNETYAGRSIYRPDKERKVSRRPISEWKSRVYGNATATNG